MQRTVYFQVYYLHFCSRLLIGFVRRAGTKYAVAVFGMFDGGQSLPLAGEERTTLIDPSDPPPMDLPGKASLYVILTHN